MKQGFTLIELLAVIAILAIIMLIATPKVLDAIENSRISAYKQDEQMIVKATETYFGNNVDLLPENVGDTVEITLTDLKTNEMISEISDCNGYILVTKTETGYSYNPELKCGDANTIGDSTKDGLVAHYTFDDFQEPTENIFAGDGSFDSSYGQHIGNPALSNSNYTRLYGNWKCSTNYNDGICRIEKGGLVSENKLVWDYNLVDGWKGVTLYTGMTLPANKTYTVSVYKRHRSGEAGNVGAYAFYGPEGYRYWFSWEKGASENPGEWIRGTATFTPDIDINGTPYLYGHYESTDLILEYDGYQIEEKAYATPFTKDSREGILTDYSSNSNSVELQLESTPRWMEENGNGYYNFSELSDKIIIPHIETFDTNNLTYSAWLKLSSYNPDLNLGSVIMMKYGASKGVIMSVLATGNLHWRPHDGTSMYTITSAKKVSLDEWHFVTGTIEGTQASLYLDGELVANNNAINYTPYLGTLNIGQWGDGVHYIFDGDIDEIKVYNRALSDEEIKYQYDTQKSIYE